MAEAQAQQAVYAAQTDEARANLGTCLLYTSRCV